MGKVKDTWDDITGKTARREARRDARRAQAEAENRAAKSRVFAETEGQGLGSLGEVALGLEDEVLEQDLKKSKKNMLL